MAATKIFIKDTGIILHNKRQTGIMWSNGICNLSEYGLPWSTSLCGGHLHPVSLKFYLFPLARRVSCMYLMALGCFGLLARASSKSDKALA